MGKWKVIIPIALSLVIALTLTISLYKWVKKQTTEKDAVQAKQETVSIVVAAVDLPWGTKLESKMIKTLPYIKESLPPGYLSSTESLEGRVLISPLRPNQPILEPCLAPVSVTTGGVSAIVTSGKRALAVKGDKVIGLSGFIRPGNRVDVLVTITVPKTKEEVTKTVLEDVLVLATGIEIQEKSEGGKPHSVDVYTLEVTPEEGERLALASAKGKLHFALRNVTDKETVLTKGATISGTVESFLPKTKTRRQGKKAAFVVEVINGDQVTRKRF
jgi:pilus assembly protein CpaB